MEFFHYLGTVRPHTESDLYKYLYDIKYAKDSDKYLLKEDEN